MSVNRLRDSTSTCSQQRGGFKDEGDSQDFYNQKRVIPKKNRRLTYQQGFSLPEVVIAALLLSVSLLGLLQYQQTLLQRFQQQWQLRQAWSLAQQNIEILTNKDTFLSGAQLPEPAKNWQYTQSREPLAEDCIKLNVRVTTPQKQNVNLSRWFCGSEK